MVIVILSLSAPKAASDPVKLTASSLPSREASHNLINPSSRFSRRQFIKIFAAGNAAEPQARSILDSVRSQLLLR